MSSQQTLPDFAGSTDTETTRPDCAATNDAGGRCGKAAVPTLAVCQYHLDVPEDLGEQVGDLLADPLYCTTCATQVRDIYPDYDEAEAIRLSVGPTTQAFAASGYEIAEDGTVDVDPRLRLTSNATHEQTPDGPVVFCETCGREPDDRVGGSRPQERLVDVAQRLADSLDLDVDDSALAEAVDASNDADTHDPDVIAEALLRVV